MPSRWFTRPGAPRAFRVVGFKDMGGSSSLCVRLGNVELVGAAYDSSLSLFRCSCARFGWGTSS